jgi:ABC-2 type transport system permease protein
VALAGWVQDNTPRAALVTNATGQLAAALGMAAAGFGISAGIASFTSVIAPYAMPDSTNPLAVNSGDGSAKGLLSLAGMIVALVLASPLLVGYFLLPQDIRWMTLPAGVGAGLAVRWLGTHAAGALLDRSAPEVLDAVTPRR